MENLYFFKANVTTWPTTANTIVLKDDKGLIIFDPGSGLPVNVKLLIKKMKQAHLYIEDTHTIVISHAHPDHYGAIGSICQISKFSKVSLFIHPVEMRIGSDGVMQRKMYGMDLIRNHFDLTDVDNARTYDNISRFLNRFCPPTDIPPGVEIQYLQDGDTVRFFDSEFKVICTPGHSPGHLSFYEVNRRLLFSGDLIGDEAAIWYAPLSGGATGYLESLRKLDMLDIDMGLPSHGGIFSNIGQRINTIRNKIQQKENDIVQQLKRTPIKFCDLAVRMFDHKNYRFFPGTIILASHLEKLEAERRIWRKNHLLFA
jgi:glyoxylase-like metal-dependent hydrolase (beta-lactamase superfamily II)